MTKHIFSNKNTIMIDFEASFSNSTKQNQAEYMSGIIDFCKRILIGAPVRSVHKAGGDLG